MKRKREKKQPSAAVLFGMELVKLYLSDRVASSAAALAYYFLFSFFPFLVFISMLLGFLAIPVESVTSDLRGFLPSEVLELIAKYLKYVTEIRSGNLLVFGLVFTLYFPTRAVDFLMTTVNHAYRINHNRPFFRHQGVVFLYTLFLMFVIFLALTLLAISPRTLSLLAGLLEFPRGLAAGWNYVRFFVLGGILFAALVMLYHLAPNRKMPLKSVLPGALVSLVGWMVISAGFAFYVENLSRYSLLYGSIGAIIVLLIWLYFSAAILITGAEINHLLMVWKQGKPAAHAFSPRETFRRLF